MSETQIDQKVVELKKELLKLNAQRATGTTLENPGKVRQVKKMIARLYTYRKIGQAKPKVKPVKTEGGKSNKK